jgi:hypothetical protein
MRLLWLVVLCLCCALVYPLGCSRVLVLACVALFRLCEVFGGLLSLCTLVCPLGCFCVLMLPRIICALVVSPCTSYSFLLPLAPPCASG